MCSIIIPSEVGGVPAGLDYITRPTPLEAAPFLGEPGLEAARLLPVADEAKLGPHRVGALGGAAPEGSPLVEPEHGVRVGCAVLRVAPAAVPDVRHPPGLAVDDALVDIADVLRQPRLLVRGVDH